MCNSRPHNAVKINSFVLTLSLFNSAYSHAQLVLFDLQCAYLRFPCAVS
jgi:hypothetical protein